MGKNKHSKVMSFSNILGEAEIHTIPYKLLRNPNNPQSMGNVKFHTVGTLWGKLIYYKQYQT